jgi:hypothetical protein
VAIGFAPRRPSRTSPNLYVTAWLRWPVRAVVRVRYPPSCPWRCVGPRSRPTQGRASASDALPMGLVGTDCALGFRPCSFHRAMQVLRVCAVCAFSAPPAFPPCSCPLAFQHQVRRPTSRISSKSFPASTGIQFELLRRTARHERTLFPVTCMRLLNEALRAGSVPRSIHPIPEQLAMYPRKTIPPVPQPTTPHIQEV